MPPRRRAQSSAAVRLTLERIPVEIVGNMISWDDKLRMWRIHGTPPRVVFCPLCDEEMTRCPPDDEDERWVCLNISAHQEALDGNDRMPGLRFMLVPVPRVPAHGQSRLLQPYP